MSAAKMTTDHEQIRRWVEKHGGQPAAVKRTRAHNDPGLIRIDFPGFSGEKSLQAIPWDEWFSKFDEQQLAFLYQDGKNTNFNKLVRRDAEQSRSSGRTRRAAGASRRRTTSRSTGAETQKRGERRRSSAARTRSSGSTRRANAGASRTRAGKSSRVRNQRSAGLQQLTRAELYERAREAGISNRSAMKKDELIKALERR